MKKLAKQVGSAKKQTMGSKLSYIMSLKEFWEARGWGWNISGDFYHHRIL